MAGKGVIKDKDDVLGIVGEALSMLRREDGIFSYGVVEDQANGGQLIYFDLPRVSPLQFNIKLGRGQNRAQAVALVKEAIQSRLESDSSDAGKNFGLS